jgi:hypothetical protein
MDCTEQPSRGRRSRSVVAPAGAANAGLRNTYNRAMPQPSFRSPGSAAQRAGRRCVRLARSALTTLAAAAVLAGCAGSPCRSTDDRLERTAQLALLQTLNADLLSHDSATLTLERWCADHRMADPPRIVAQRVRGAAKPLPQEWRARLQIGADIAPRYRHVQLRCGTHVLSEADNWYVSERLTPQMNRMLDTTDAPFGKVVQALGFRRRTLSAQLLWSPLPAGWENAVAAVPPAAALDVPGEVLRHVAVLYSAQQQPFSIVVETYTDQVLAFGDRSAVQAAH